MERVLLNDVPSIVLAIGMVGLAIVTALIGLWLVRRNVELRTLESQHEVAGFILAVVGVIYAVLLAFVVVISWEQYSSAASVATTEATAVGNLYRDAVALGRPGRRLAAAVDSYAYNVAYREWPYMASHLAADPVTNHSQKTVFKAVATLPPPAGGTSAEFVRQAVTDLSAATEARSERIDDSSSELPPPLWAVLLVGGALTVGFTYFFGLKSFLAEAVMVGTLAAIIGLMLFVILSLDLPFTGDVATPPTAMISELNEFCSYEFVLPGAGAHCRREAAFPALGSRSGG
jgi:hypothetical protein